MFKKLLVLASLIVFMFSNAYGGVTTVSSLKHTTWGNYRVTMGTLTVAGSYGANGVALTPRQLGLTTVFRTIIMPYSGSVSSVNTDWYYNGSTYLKGYQRNTNTFKPVNTSPAASDSLIIFNKAIGGGDAETTNVFVALTGASPPFAGLLTRDAMGVAGLATSNYDKFCNADSSIQMIMCDTTLDFPRVKQLGSLWNADTLFFDYNATDAASRFMYTGTMLGPSGPDLYIPFGEANFIKVKKITGATRYSSGAVPVYYVRTNTNLCRQKLMSDVVGSIRNYNGALADSTYTCLPRYFSPGTEIESGRVCTALLYFIAIGN